MANTLVVDAASELSFPVGPPGDHGAPRNTKIVATIGPATASETQIRALLLAGTNVVRFNFSHADHTWATNVLNTVRAVSKELQLPVAVMQDLCGPKIRVSQLSRDPFVVAPGDVVRITTDHHAASMDADGDPQFDIVTTYVSLIHDVETGHHILFDDGRVELVVEEKQPGRLIGRVLRGGPISRGKGMNLPGITLSTASMTDKDWADLEWGIRHEVEFIALSFVRRPDDVRAVRERLDECRGTARIIAKIERPEAIDCVEEILQLADGLMVARGDLGLETELARVPSLQKNLIERCRLAGKPVVTATQMLESMVHDSTPTRAEVSDVANAIYDGTDAIMLSAETANGDFPEAAVACLDRVARVTEADLSTRIRFERRAIDASTPASAIVEGAAVAALSLSAGRVVVYSQSGLTARLMARGRLPMPVVAVTNNSATYRQLSLSYGVHPVLLPQVSNLPRLLAELDGLVVKQQWGKTGDMLVIVSALDGRDGHIDTLHLRPIR